MYEDRCDERLKGKTEGSMYLDYTLTPVDFITAE
jgi:hypothetical protein